MDRHPAMGELLLREGLLTEKQLLRALEEQRHSGGRLGYHLIRLGYVNVQRLSQFLKNSMGLIPYDLSGWVKDRSVMDYIPSNLAQFYQVVPVEKSGSVLTVAIADLDNPSIIPALEELTGLSIDPVVCPRETVIHALEHFYGVAKDPGVVRNMAGDHLFVLSQSSKRIRPIHWSALKPDSSAAEWLRTVLVEAIRMGCRTVAIKPDEKAVRVSFKTGETVQDRFALASRKREEMDALLFELARLRDVQRGPRQEGRVRLQVESRFLTLHVKAMSTLQGTRYTLTLYDEKLLHKDWERLNGQLEPGECKDLDTALSGGPGLLLLAGSPGPGITQVYYALMDHLSRRYQPAVTLEEYSLMVLRGISQQEVSREEASTWPELISMALKQEPALFACFPVKERQSMELALLAASHTRVVAVLHQPDAVSTLRWLLRNQFRSPLRAGVLKGILTVASIPRLCGNCRLPAEVVGRDGQVYPLFTRQGCEQCLSWESLPSEAVMEWLPMNDRVKELLGDEPQAPDLIRCILEVEGIPLAHRVLAGARDGLLDAQEARDFLP